MPRPTTAKPSSTTNRNKSNAEKDKNSMNFSEKSWVDRWAKELKGQREWSQKWGVLNDPKLYLGETANETFPNRHIPTQWAAFSVINPPGREPTLSKPEIPQGYTPPTFKITGERQIKKYSKSNINASNASNSSMKNVKLNVHGNSSLPAHYTAPYSTATPVPNEDINRIERQHRASCVMYHSSLVGARAGGKAEFAKDPQSVYKYPATTSMEYGWTFHRKTLELYGK